MSSTSRILPGVVSVTFRSLPVRQIVELAVETKLAAIEWGGDIHVPHGNLAAARQARQMCRDHGLAVSAYGSYLRIGAPETAASIAPVLDTAAELRTPLVRVWAGTRSSAGVDQTYRKAIANQLTECCDQAAQRGLAITMEFHSHTLTDDIDSCLHLLQQVNRPNLHSSWQPPNGMQPQTAIAGLQKLGAHLANLHVFHWWPDEHHRHPLLTGEDRWTKYLAQAAKQCEQDRLQRYASLEFVLNDSIEQFRADAETLRRWLDVNH